VGADHPATETTEHKVPGKDVASSNTDAALTDEPALDSAQLAKLALEIGPLAVFFLTNWRAGIFWGTGAFMVATVVALTVSRWKYGRIPLMPLITGVFVMVFGALTIWLHDDLFIKLKPTIVNTLFSIILFTGLFFGRSFLKYIFGEILKLREEGWRILTFRWATFFLFLAVINEIVWRSFSTDTWVSFKVFGLMPITFIFAMAQIGLIKEYEETETQRGPRSGETT